MKAAVLLSGGVDSSTALRLAQEAGYDVSAYYLKIWLQDDFAFLGECPWEEDVRYARAVCEQAGVDLNILPLQDEYWERVVSYTIREIKAGRTPNPDVFCNSLVKFGVFLDRVGDSIDRVVTGHYARVDRSGAEARLFRSPDPVKDQTYFLAYLSQAQLRLADFPLGTHTKREVRALAERFDLPSKHKKDSQGICFLGQIKFRDFVKSHLGDAPGAIVEVETGKTLGEHPGYYYFTIGQRSGLGLSGGPWYVVRKDAGANVVYVSHKAALPDRPRRRFEVEDFNWFVEAPHDGRYDVKIRHGARLFGADFARLSDDRGAVTLDEPDPGVAAGQFAVFYRGEECVGGAKIAECEDPLE